MSSVIDCSNEVDEPTRALLSYCAENDINISSKISPRRIENRGLGIYSTARILKGEKLMHVPTSALFTTKIIPDSFLSRTARKDLPVHAQLATYLTFGVTAGVNPYEKWMATWPRLTDFTSTMPMLWPEQIVNPTPPDPSPNPAKRRKIIATLCFAGEAIDISTLPPPTTGKWSLSSTKVCPSGSTPLAGAQQLKLQDHMKQVASLFPQHADDLLSPTSPTHWRFVHMWCCVNTRCFYYLHPRQTKPSDANEAMAMCPGMDLFNHTDQTGCFTKYDKKGYKVTADREYEAGEEVFLSYGSHTNDVLWAEYGFMMDENTEDAVQIDYWVLKDFRKKERLILEENNFSGEYWFGRHGPCWRSIVASFGGIVGVGPWKKMMKDGTWATNGFEREDRAQRMEIALWLESVSFSAMTNVESLKEWSEDQIIDQLADSVEILAAQGHEPDQVDIVRKQVALKRHSMCVSRWDQIEKLAMEGLKSFQSGW